MLPVGVGPWCTGMFCVEFVHRQGEYFFLFRLMWLTNVSHNGRPRVSFSGRGRQSRRESRADGAAATDADVDADPDVDVDPESPIWYAM